MDLMTEQSYKTIVELLKDRKKRYRCYQLKEWKGIDGIRERALKRDRHECQDCKRKGKYSKAVDVHHIVELKDNPRLFLKLDNVVSLCKDCHNARHKRLQYVEADNFTTVERW